MAQETQTKPDANKSAADKTKTASTSKPKSTQASSPRAANGAAKRPSEEVMAKIKQLGNKIDPELIKQREGWRDRNGNVHMVDYIEWHTVADILDKVAPEWEHTVADIREIGDNIVVTAAISIGGITREGMGTGAADTEMGIKKAEHDALKRAAVKFGIGRELYKKESEFIERTGGGNQGQNAGGFPNNPRATGQFDLVSPKQLGMIRALAREKGLDADEESMRVMDTRTDDLNKKAASALIGHLQTYRPEDHAMQSTGGRETQSVENRPDRVEQSTSSNLARAGEQDAFDPTQGPVQPVAPVAVVQPVAPVAVTQPVAPVPPAPTPQAEIAPTHEPVAMLSEKGAAQIREKAAAKFPGVDIDAVVEQRYLNTEGRNITNLMDLTREQGRQLFDAMKNNPEKITALWKEAQKRITPEVAPAKSALEDLFDDF